MPIDIPHYARSLVSLHDATTLMDKARAYLAAWPDPFLLAHDRAAQYLLEHTGQVLDPDRVWWHTFDTAVSAPTYTGWRHAGRPVRSLRFTELFVQRFGGGFQSAPDQLPVYGGFYLVDGNAREFGSGNELRLDAQQVMTDFWNLDFAAHVRHRSECFWDEEGRDFGLLARASFVAALAQGCHQKVLADAQRRQLMAWLGLAVDVPVTLQALDAATPGGGMRVLHHPSSGRAPVVTLEDQHGWIFLYAPAASQAVRGFADRDALLAWAGTDGAQAPALSFDQAQPLHTDLFEALRSWAADDLQTCQQSLVSNTDLRKQLWRGYLGAFIHVFGSFPAAAWPLGLLLLGAGAARLGLDIELAVRARSALLRREAILAALGDALVLVFSIIDVGLGARALTYRVPAHERLGSLEHWLPGDGPTEELDNLEANRVLEAQVQDQGLLDGIRLSDDGTTWIEMRDMTLRARYSPTLSHWLVTPEGDSQAFFSLLPVRNIAPGPWQLVAPSGDLDLLTSRFWDVYMQHDPLTSEGLSQEIFERQDALLRSIDPPRIDVDEPPSVDEHGWHHVQRDGKRFYTFEQDGCLHNLLVMNYSMEVAQVNNLFRVGRANIEVESVDELYNYLTVLFDSLQRLPRSQAQRLWRGGSNQRATGGLRYRTGQVNVGDVLVTTDLTSFTENPYILRTFMATKTGQTFDSSSVVYEIVGDGLRGGAPVAPLSMHPQEAEVLYTPGHYLRIVSVREVVGAGYSFIRVRLREVGHPQGEPVLDLRTGEPFDRQAYAERVGNPALVERFFPLAPASREEQLGT